MNWSHQHLKEAGSTNDWAMAWLKQRSLTHPLLVTTDHQTSGRGQRGKTWEGQKGLDLAMSFVVPVRGPLHPPSLNKAVAVVVRQTLAGLDSSLDPVLEIKWPNDVLIRRNNQWEKVCGILVENVWRGAEWTHVVVGVGVNVNSNPDVERATSLKAMAGKEFDVPALAQTMASGILDTIQGGLKEAAAYANHLHGCHEARPFLVQGERRTGTFLGVNHEGLGEFLWADCREDLPSTDVVWLWDQA